MTTTERLDRLISHDLLAAYEAPHPNHGLAGGEHPWVLMWPNPKLTRLVPPEAITEVLAFLEVDIPAQA